MKVINKVEEILKDNTLCVLCTTDGGYPHCSLMTYALGDDMRILYMVSMGESRKFKNLLANPNVSVLVDNRQQLTQQSDKNVVSVTFEGIHQPLDEEERERVRAYLASTHVELNAILANPDCIIFGIRLKTFLLLNDPVDSLKGDL